jgi:hypothetical protein
MSVPDPAVMVVFQDSEKMPLRRYFKDNAKPWEEQHQRQLR